MKQQTSIQSLRDSYHTEFITNLELQACFGDNSAGSSKVTRLVKAGGLIRVKRGLYLFGNAYRKTEPVTLQLANLVYGPSYVSLESALSFYGLIPEAVYQVTSIHNKKPKHFKTPIGSFSYRCIPQSAFPIEVSSHALTPHAHVLIASKEKALLDKIYLDGPRQDLFSWVTQSLRIEEHSLSQFRSNILEELSTYYKSKPFTQAVSIFVNDLIPLKNAYAKTT